MAENDNNMNFNIPPIPDPEERGFNYNTYANESSNSSSNNSNNQSQNQDSNQNRGFDGTSTNQAKNDLKPNIPNSGAILTLGILSLVTILCCGACVSPILAIIALALFPSAKNKYLQNPDFYSENSYSNIKTGKILAIVGLCISLFFIILLAIVESFTESTEIIKETFDSTWDAMGY
jgi:hypothetical protein